MRIIRILMTVLFLPFAGCAGAFAADEDGVMAADNMGDGAEYGSGDNRALEIDEHGDGDYNSGDGSVVETSSPGSSDEGDSD